MRRKKKCHSQAELRTCFETEWAKRGSDPENERRVAEEFEAKANEAKDKISDSSFWDSVNAMYEYVKSGDDLAIKAIIVGALLYFISPFDIVPDFLPGVGYFDDIGVIALVANQVKNAIAKFMGKG